MSENEMLSHFDRLFETDVKEHIELNMPLLKSIFDRLYELPTMSSPTYKEITNKKSELSNKITSLLPDEGKEIFEEYKRLMGETEKIEDYQLFCFGYIFAKEFEREGKLEK